MQVLMTMSIFWILYGIAGVFGFQNIPHKYKGYSWTKYYIRCQGISWLLIGIPWLVLYLLITFFFADTYIRISVVVLILLVLAIPAIIYTIRLEKRFKALLERETDHKTVG